MIIINSGKTYKNNYQKAMKPGQKQCVFGEELKLGEGAMTGEASSLQLFSDYRAERS